MFDQNSQSKYVNTILYDFKQYLIWLAKMLNIILNKIKLGSWQINYLGQSKHHKCELKNINYEFFIIIW